MGGVGGVSSSGEIGSFKIAENGLNTYLKELSAKFPDLQIRRGTVTDEMMKPGELKPEDTPPHGAGDGNVFIDSRYLKKMKDDPEEAQRGEGILSSIPDAEKKMKADFAAQILQSPIPGGTMKATLIDHGTIIDKDGNVSDWATAFVQGSTPSASEMGGGLLGGMTASSGKKDKKAHEKALNAGQRLLEQLQQSLAKKETFSPTTGGSLTTNLLA